MIVRKLDWKRVNGTANGWFCGGDGWRVTLGPTVAYIRIDGVPGMLILRRDPKLQMIMNWMDEIEAAFE